MLQGRIWRYPVRISEEAERECWEIVFYPVFFFSDYRIYRMKKALFTRKMMLSTAYLRHPRSGKRFDAVFITFKLVKIISTAFLSFLVNGKSF
jgi:hypothetical protein